MTLNRSLLVQRLFILSALVLLVVACSPSGNSEDVQATNAPPPPTATPLPISQSTSLPEDSVQVVNDINTLVIWWPELLPVTETLQTQLQDYTVITDGNIEINFRLKRVGDTGGIMSTLRTGIDIAPSAMPDITLMRREDLTSAIQQGLIQPMSGISSLSASVIGGLYDVALSLGEYDNQQYGVAYVLNVLHVAYMAQDDDNVTPQTWSFSDLLTREQPFVFPAGRQIGMNDTFFLQYLAAGGAPPDENGSMLLDTDALLTVLSFYESAVEAGTVNDEVFGYSTDNDYQSSLASGVLSSAVTRSSQYLTLRQEDPTWHAAPVPTESGAPTSLVDGWMWVIVASNADQQAIAVNFLNWVMDTERQRQYAESALRVPSTQLALRNMDRDLLDTDVMDDMVNNGFRVVPQSTGSALARAMQNALVAVVSGERNAEEATQDVIDIVGDTG